MKIIEKLREEITITQKSRRDFIIRKITFLLTLIGIGNINIISKLNMNLLLYFIPIVAIGFDLYIAGEDFAIKRIGAFLSKMSTDTEMEYEKFVSGHRDIFSILGNIIFSFFIIFLLFIILIKIDNKLNIYHAVFLAYLIPTILIVIFTFKQRKKLLKYVDSMDNGNIIITSVTASPTKLEQITIRNYSSFTVDLTRWTIGYQNAPKAYSIPTGFTLDARQSHSFSNSTLNLQVKNTGETICLSNSTGIKKNTW